MANLEKESLHVIAAISTQVPQEGRAPARWVPAGGGCPRSCWAPTTPTGCSAGHSSSTCDGESAAQAVTEMGLTVELRGRSTSVFCNKSERRSTQGMTCFSAGTLCRQLWLKPLSLPQIESQEMDAWVCADNRRCPKLAACCDRQLHDSYMMGSRPCTAGRRRASPWPSQR